MSERAEPSHADYARLGACVAGMLDAYLREQPSDLLRLQLVERMIDEARRAGCVES